MIIHNYAFKEISARWVISYKLVFIFTPLMIFPIAIEEATLEDTHVFFLWSLSSFFGLAPAAVIYILSDKFYFRKIRNLNIQIWKVILFGGVVGFAKGIGTAFFIYHFDLLDTHPLDDLITRILGATLIGLFLIPALAIIGNSFSLFKVSRRKIIDQFLLHEYSRLENENISQQLRSQLSKKVDTKLIEILKKSKLKLDNSKSLENEYEQTAKVLRDIAESAVRPLSHELWKRQNKRIQLKVYDYLKFSFHTIKFNTYWVILLYSITSLVNIENNAETYQQLINLLIRNVLLFILLTTAQAVYEISPSNSNGRFISLLTIVLLIHSFGVWWTNFISNMPNTIFILLDTFWLALLIFGCGIIQAMLFTQSFEIAKLESRATEAKLKAHASKNELDRFSREIAKYLHGTVQSRLMASAISIENAAKFGDKKNFQKQVDKALESLEMPSYEYVTNKFNTIENIFKDLKSQWDGILEIKVSVGRSMRKESQNLQKKLMDITEEALANSFRHGQSTKVKISLYINTENNPEIEIIDNGSGIKEFVQGMGCQLYSSVSDHWSLDSNINTSGATLRLEFSPRSLN